MDLKKTIKQRGYTLEELAKQMTKRDGTRGISTPAMYQILNGNPTLSRLQEIANILGISVSELLAGDTARGAVCPHCGKPLNITIS